MTSITRRLFIGLALTLIGVTTPRAQETYTLSTPVTKASRSTYHLSSVLLDLDGKRVIIKLVADNGDELGQMYDGDTTPTGAALLSALNTANLSSNSLVKRIYQRLQTDGVVAAGTIGGSPQ